MCGAKAPGKYGAPSSAYSAQIAKQPMGGWSKVPEIMTMVGDSGAEKPSLKGDVPLVFLLNCIRDCMRVKQYSPHTYTEQPYLDWIKRFIHFYGKRHRQRSRPTFGT